MEKAIRDVRSAAVDIVYNSLLQGWGNSSVTICDLDQTVDLDQFHDTEDPEHNMFIVVDGAHRMTALAKITEKFPERWRDFKIPCSYLGRVNYDDRITYAFGKLSLF